MWTKDCYQEQMLGYLDGVLTEIELLEEVRIRRKYVNELYDDLEIALDRLWRLIGANDSDWEQFRFTLETSCDELLRVYNRALRSSGLYGESDSSPFRERRSFKM